MRRVRLGRWTWTITDGMTGPTLASGTAWTARAAMRRRLWAEARCHRRTPQHDLEEIVQQLHAEGIDVEAHFDDRQRVCVRPACACSDRDHRRVMAAFLAIASPVLWEVA